MRRNILAVAIFAVTTGCTDEGPLYPSGLELAAGIWGGKNAGLIVDDETAHIHIACTFGNVTGEVPIDGMGNFSVSGSYRLRAYPIVVGPELPARFDGRITGSRLRLTVTVDDTVEKKTVVLGPVTLQYGVNPEMAACPICRTKPFRMTGMFRRQAT